MYTTFAISSLYVSLLSYVVIQCIVRDNMLVQQYVTENYSRAWRLSTASISLDNKSQLPQEQSQLEVKEDDIFFDSNKLVAVQDDVIEVSKHRTLLKRYELLKDLVIEHGTDTFGATVTLAQLLNSSENIIQRLVNNELMLRFRKLGKYLRHLLSLFLFILFLSFISLNFPHTKTFSFICLLIYICSKTSFL